MYSNRDVRFEWVWTDWLGLLALIIAISFVVTVAAALIEGISPLKILRHVSGLLSMPFKRK